jgi:hypothetical protein
MRNFVMWREEEKILRVEAHGVDSGRKNHFNITAFTRHVIKLEKKGIMKSNGK